MKEPTPLMTQLLSEWFTDPNNISDQSDSITINFMSYICSSSDKILNMVVYLFTLSIRPNGASCQNEQYW